MAERLKKIQARLLEFWNRYTKKQRTIFLSIVGGIIVLLVVLIIVLSRTVYINLASFTDKTMAANAVNTLTTNNIKAKLQTSGSNYVVQVDKNSEIEATILITGTYGDTELFSINSLLDNSLTTTDSDRRLKNDLYIRSEIEAGLKSLNGINDAAVIFYPTGTQSSILTGANEKACSVILTTNSGISSKTAGYLAQIIASALGNKDTGSIKIMDQNMNLLFGASVSKEEEELTQREQWITWITDFYSDRIVELGEKNGFDTTVGLYLNFNFDEMSYAYKEYIAAEGSDQGLYSIYKKVESENTAGPGDVTGTDANDETDYYVVTGGNGNSSYTSTEIHYTPNEKLTNFVKDNTQVDHNNSSVSIVLNKVTTVNESDLTDTLNELGIGFEEYVRRNSAPKLLDDSYSEQLALMTQIFSNATHIPLANITVVGYEVFNYVAEERSPFDFTIIFRIVLAVLIVGLLLFVLLRGMRPEEVVEQEPELSIEQLLATTKENQSLEDIELSEKSETLRLIEKLIDENPQAVSNLLRNWLEDDWG